MAVPERLLNFRQVPYHLLIPCELHIFKFPSQNHHRKIPASLPRYRHVMKALDDVMLRYPPILPLIGTVGTGRLAFQPCVLPHYQPVHIRQHKGMLRAFVHYVGTPHL